MLKQTLLVCFCIVMVGADSDQPLWSGGRLMTEFNQQTQVSLQLQALKVQSYLSSLPAQCALTHWASVQDAQVEALHSYHKCNTKVVLENIGRIFVDTSAFAITVYSYGSNMVAEVAACSVAAKVNPAKWFVCILTVPQKVYRDVKGIASEVKTFYSQMKSLMPRIVTGIGKCLLKSSTDYQQLLDGIVSVAKTCMEDYDH